jgi:hypothetical protein
MPEENLWKVADEWKFVSFSKEIALFKVKPII